jgi:alkanesulfonate monooxygenase
MMLGGVDLAPYDIDRPLPDDLPRPPAPTSAWDTIRTLGKRENLSIRQLYLKLGNARGQRILKGTPKDIADDLQHWVESEGADGFNLMPTHLPGGLNDFVDMVIPELQRRGLFRTDYEGRTLRDNLGLPRPASRYAGSADLPSAPKHGAGTRQSPSK